MRAIILAHLYNTLLKLHPGELKHTHLNKVRLQNFSLSSCFSSSLKENDFTQFSLSGIEQLTAVPTVSKKNKQLSQVAEEDMELVEKLKKGDPVYPYQDRGDRMKKVLGNECKVIYNNAVKLFTGIRLGDLEIKYFDRFTDVLIIGGGAVGLSIAHALKSNFQFGPKVTVVDKDSCFPHTFTNSGQGIVTQQFFTDEEEIDILKYGAEFFSAFSRNTEIEGKAEFTLSYDPLGTLILADTENAEKVLKRNDILRLYGIYNKTLDQNTLRRKFPWLNIKDVVFGSLSMGNEGVIDPWSYLVGLKCKALNLGVDFVNAEVIDFGCNDGDFKRAVCKLPDGSYNSIDFAYCIIACGLESLNLVHMINELKEMEFTIKLPLEERLRYEYCFYSPDGPGLNTPTVIGSDGTYFRRVGLTGHYVAGVPSVINEEVNDPYQVFHDKVKPFLMKRTPGMSNVELVKGWIDAYDFCIANEVGITGPHPDTPRIIFALGFSHLGLQYLPALARGIMEYIYYDGYQTIDFTPFHLNNLWRKWHLEAERQRKELLESQERIALPR